MKLVSDTLEIYPSKGPARAKRYGDAPIDLSDPDTFRNGPPWADFKKMRADIPVAWNEERLPEQPGFWALTRYDDVMRVDGDPQGFSSQRGGALMAHTKIDMPLARASLNQMLMLDGTAHLQLRREHMPVRFTPESRGAR